MLKLFKNLKNYAGYIAITLACVLTTSILDLFLPDYMSEIISKGVVGKDVDYIWKIGGIMLIISAVSMTASIIGSYCSSISGMGFGKTVREKIFTKVENFSQNEFDKFSTPSLITRTTNDVNQMQMLVMIAQRMMVSAPFMFVGGIIMAARKDAGLLWILLIILPIIVVVAMIMMKVTLPLFTSMQKKIDRINLVLREKLSGIRVIRAFNKNEYEDGRFKEANKDLTETSLKVGKIMALLMPLMMLVMNATSLLILWFGGASIENPANIGNLMAFMQYIMQIMMSFMMATMMFVMIPRAAVSADRINEVLDCEFTVVDSDKTVPLFVDNTKNIIEFKNVTFTYGGASAPVIKNISFTAEKGETVAIIGSTGSGKSTLVNLIPRFYDVTEGEILFYGTNITQLAQKELRDNMGYIPQKAFLFDGTVAENIKEGKEDATEEEIQKALEISQAWEFVSQMPEQAESHISQGATNVSGGQKQRLSIARALARNVGLYIFDDTFSALDFKTDAKLRAAIKENLTDACVLIVAQRVGTIMNADKIIVLENGEICGIGTHKNLLESCAVYKEIVESQLTEEEIA
ncbi:MAG: ABC transporter ATP-binding protein/permease [Oscillospiraceae bacterium]|nr:ABC transporter ATP-binding protein/permease [Oscillospiraceae bacterium]